MSERGKIITGVLLCIFFVAVSIIMAVVSWSWMTVFIIAILFMACGSLYRIVKD